MLPTPAPSPDSATPTSCVHRWACGTPDCQGLVRANCRNCGAERVFSEDAGRDRATGKTHLLMREGASRNGLRSGRTNLERAHEKRRLEGDSEAQKDASRANLRQARAHYLSDGPSERRIQAWRAGAVAFQRQGTSAVAARTAERLDLARELLLEGLSVVDAAREARTRRRAVTAIAKELGLDSRSRSAARRARVRTLLAEGLPVSAICSLAKVSAGTVSAVRRDQEEQE